MWATLAFILLSFSSSSLNAQTISQKLLQCKASRLSKAQPCTSGCTDDPSELQKMCLNPVQYVCDQSPPDGLWFNSECKFSENDSHKTPEVSEIAALVTKMNEKADSMVAEHLPECQMFGHH